MQDLGEGNLFTIRKVMRDLRVVALFRIRRVKCITTTRGK